MKEGDVLDILGLVPGAYDPTPAHRHGQVTSLGDLAIRPARERATDFEEMHGFPASVDVHADGFEQAWQKNRTKARVLGRQRIRERDPDAPGVVELEIKSIQQRLVHERDREGFGQPGPDERVAPGRFRLEPGRPAALGHDLNRHRLRDAVVAEMTRDLLDEVLLT